MSVSEVKGKHIISDEVIATIVLDAASDSTGVYLPYGIANGITERFSKKQSTKGIRVEQNDEGVVIEMKVIADYGINIPEACKALQEKVAEKVLSLTGRNVLRVNINVTDINVTTPAPEKEKTP